VTGFVKRYLFSHTKFDPFFELWKFITYLSKTFHVQSYFNGLPFEMKRSLISSGSENLQHTVCYHVKCLEKVPFHKLGYVLYCIILIVQNNSLGNNHGYIIVLTVMW